MNIKKTGLVLSAAAAALFAAGCSNMYSKDSHHSSKPKACRNACKGGHKCSTKKCNTCKGKNRCKGKNSCPTKKYSHKDKS